MGRRKTYSGYLAFASSFLIAMVVIEVMGYDGNEHLISTMSYQARFGIGGAWGVVTCFTAESFPTTCRSTSMGICAFFAYTGGMVAPQMAYLGAFMPKVPHYIYTGLTIGALSSALLLAKGNKQETSGKFRGMIFRKPEK